MTKIDRKFLERLVANVNVTVRLRNAGNDDDLRDHAIDARREYAEWFRELEREGRLPSDVIDELLWHIKKGLTFELVSGVRKGVPFVAAVPKFDGHLAEVAYTLIGLASGAVAGCKVLGCKKCGTFFVADTSRKGRPRQFCSVQCQDAFGQQTYREQLKSQSRKHK
jgi:hypothetical protein